MQTVPAQLSDLPSYVVFILLNPTSDVRAAFLVYASIALILLIGLIVAIIIMMGSTKEDGVSGSKGVGQAVPSQSVRAPRRARPSKPPMSPGARLAVAAGIVLVLVAASALAGYTTSDPELCRNCHWPAAEHAKALSGTDKHAAVLCVSCHETGGMLGRYLANVPARLIHFASTQSGIPAQGEYGRVTVAACSSCHDAALEGVATNESRGLRVSHAEPLAASATCIDCHTLRAGVVGAHNAGMAPCLRCHDSKQASTECATCHDERAAFAARARTTSFAGERIPDVSCGGCHDEKQDCDGCHGMRLPHTREFMTYAHARAGAVDFWFNSGETCGRCHTVSRRPCQKCHSTLLGRGHGVGTSWLASGHQTATEAACDTCHGQLAYSASRDFCEDVCHTPAAVAGSPR